MIPVPATSRWSSRLGSVRAAALSIPGPVVVIAAGAVVGLLLVANGYGFHRDELYFVVAGQHPDWGYVDQGLVTPILSALGVALLGPTPMAIRLLPALIIGTCIVLTAAMAREMGGDRRAQAIAALAIALSGLLLAGHIAATATYDLLAWTIVSWLVVRILGGGDARLWVAVGIVGGFGLLNKYTIALLPLSLVAGLLIERRWSLFRTRWPWIGLGVALAIWSPNLLWQATHGFPQLEMARHIAAASGSENRSQLVALQAVLAGPLLWPAVVLGLWRLVSAPGARPWRAFAWTYAIALGLTYWQGGKAYYLAGLFPVLFAAGSIPVAGWVAGGRRRLRLATFGAAAAISGAAVAVLTLPILPPSVLVSSGVHDLNNESGEQIGWPELVGAVEEVVGRLSPEERARAVIITANYGEAGAIELLGDELPPVYSGHNSYWDFGRPPDDARLAIVIGSPRMSGLGDCRTEGRVTNTARVPNDEYGAPIAVCRRLPVSWDTAWPSYRHLD